MTELTTSEAVRAYEVHPNVLSRLILTGKLNARKNADGHWLISRESLEHWNSERVRRKPLSRSAVVESASLAHAGGVA
jgi:hypothetical protein